MNLVGISASGRENGITSELVQATLQATGLPYNYVSLAGLSINGCQGCTRCAGDNRCKQQDDWASIEEQLLTADAIVFGAPSYYGAINALGHACLERTFCFRHREVFSLAGKLGVAVGVDGAARSTPSELEAQRNSPAIKMIRMFMESNHMAVVDWVYGSGYSQCYSCGFGEGCAVGSVVRRHGYLQKISPEICPPRLTGQADARQRAELVGKTLGSILRAKRF